MVIVTNEDGSLVAVDDDGVGEYECHGDFQNGEPSAQIFFQ